MPPSCLDVGPEVLSSHRGPHTTQRNKRGNLKGGRLYNQGAMKARAEISTHHLQVDLHLIHPEKQPGKGCVDSWPGQFHKKSPRLQAPHERLTESAMTLQKTKSNCLDHPATRDTRSSELLRWWAEIPQRRRRI